MSTSVDRPEHPSLVGHVIGLTLGISGLGIVASGLVDLVKSGPDVGPLLVCGAIVGTIGFLLIRLTRVPERIELLDVFVTVTFAWVALAVAGALPYLVTGTLSTMDNAIFESVSGFTTTGATVLRPIEGNSPGILMWRAITQWIGGMGVIVLVVAVLPAVGSGGMDLLQAEAPGPTGERLTPRVRHTARRLWGVYLGFTIVLVGAYMVAGMDLYDGVAHSFTTVSTGGFSPYNRSLGHFESGMIEWIAIVAMFLAGGSFTLWLRVLQGKVGPLWASIELRLYVLVVGFSSLMVYLTSDMDGPVADKVRNSVFTVTSVVSTTGFGTADFGSWGEGAQAVLLLLMPIGAMAGSTAGGVKLVRVLAVASYAHRETLRQLHPRLVRPVRVGKVVLDETVTNRVLGFLVLALAVFGGSALIISMTGADMITSLSAAATTFGNVGPGLGDVGPTQDFLNLPRPARWVSVVAMLLGRLEIYPLLLALVALPGLRPTRARFRAFRHKI